jgi:hypothetical protein
VTAGRQLVQSKKAHLDALVRQRQQLEERASYWRPLGAAALTAGGIGTAALGVSTLNPFVSFAGLCIAFASVPGAVRGLVDAQTAVEQLDELLKEIAMLREEIERLERLP